MKKTLPHIYIFLWLLYYQQDGTILSRIALVILLLMSLYYLGYALTKYHVPTTMKFLAAMILGWTVYGMVPILLGSQFQGIYIEDTQSYIQPFTEIKGIYNSLLPIFAFYVFSKRGELTEKSIQKWFFVFFVVAIYTYISVRNASMLKYRADEVINNNSYVILSLLTLLPFFWKKPTLQYIILGVCLFFIITGFKRGAIIAGALSSILIVYYSFQSEHFNKRKASLRKNIVRIFMISALVIAVVYMVQFVLETSDFFNVRLMRTLDRDSSGRDEIFKVFYNHFINENNILVFLFGNGTYGTLHIYGNYAHNDWLEIAIDYGLVFLLVYVAYWVSVLVMIIKGKRGTITTMILLLFYTIYFLRTFFSMSYNSVSPYAACAVGYAFAQYEYKRPKSSNLRTIDSKQE